MRPDHPRSSRMSSLRWPALTLAVLSLLSTVAFVLAPVHRPEATYSWPAAAGDPSAVAVPLMLYLPARLDATISCADVRSAADGAVLVATTPPDTPLPGGLRPGLTVRSAGGELLVDSGGTVLDPQPVPAGDTCAWAITSTASSTTLSRDGEVLQQVDGDVRPTVASVSSELADPTGTRVDVTADTVFQTSPTGLKTTLGGLAVVALAGAVVLVARSDRRRPHPDRAPRPRAPRSAWAVDAAVVLTLALWTAIGPITIDDGYIAGIVASRDENGYVSDVYRWFNAPEAPFGWFYELLNLWSRISGSTVWMRVPSALLGLAAWMVLARALLPRLGAAGAGLGRYGLAAVVFGLWWLPFGLGLRPESWVLLGLLGVVVLVERGLERRTVTPLVIGLVVAAATLAITPTGAVAFLPYVAAAVPVLRLCRQRTDLGWAVLVVLALAAAATTALYMFGDQTVASIRLANRIRADLPGSVPWSQEYERYAVLLTAGDVQGPVARRVPVLLTLLAVGGIGWRLRRSAADVPPVVGRLLTGFGLSLVVLLFTPTKWTLHFGAFAATGTAILLVALHLFSRRGLRSDAAPPAAPAPDPGRAGGTVSTSWVRTYGIATTAVAMVAALSYAGYNQWAYLSDLAVPWNDIPPTLAGIEVSSLALAGAVLVALATAGVVVWAGAREQTSVRLPGARLLPSPATVAVLLVAVTVALEVGSFVKSSAERRDTYSLASDTASTLAGEPCGLAERLSVETDPAAGLLPAAPVPVTSAVAPDGGAGEDPEPAGADGFRPASGDELRRASADLPGWVAEEPGDRAGDGPASLTTEWFTVTDPLRDGAVPLTVTVRGALGAGNRLEAEFGRLAGGSVEPGRTLPFEDPVSGADPRDVRIDARAAGPEADVVRLVALDGGGESDAPLALSGPRAPVTSPFSEVVPASRPALVDWPVAFVFPCQELGVQALGTTDVPEWRIAAPYPSDAGDIIVAPATGGPYAAAALLVDEVEYPVYQDARPLERPVTLLRWVPREEIGAPRVTVADETVASWAG